MTKKLQKDLIELSKKVSDHCKINSYSLIKGDLIELSEDISLPYIFECEALHPGTFKGYTIEEREIIKAQNTIFQSNGNFHNYEINKDHKNQYREDSSVDDLLGKVIGASYDVLKKAYILKGEIYDKVTALKVANKIIKYVSLRINPQKVDIINDVKYARELSFEELSFVRAPGDPNVKIL